MILAHPQATTRARQERSRLTGCRITLVTSNSTRWVG